MATQRPWSKPDTDDYAAWRAWVANIGEFPMCPVGTTKLFYRLMCQLADAVPAYHDRPTVPGLWVVFGDMGSGVYDIKDINAEERPGGIRWYGPIPQDGQAVKP